MMELTLKEKQEIIENAPELAEFWANGMFYKCCDLTGEYKVLKWSKSLNTDEWHEDFLVSLQDIRKEMEREKQIKIVDAVNQYKAVWAGEGLENLFEGNIAYFWDCGDSMTNGAKFVCHKDAFNQCIKELSEAAWLNKEAPSEPQYYNTYKRAYDDMQDAKEAGWDGNGLPPAGEEVRYYCSEGDEWRTGFSVAIDGEVCVIRDHDDNLYAGCHEYHIAKPETEQQKADRELHEQVSKIMERWGHERHEHKEDRGVSLTYTVVEQMLKDGYKL